MLGGVMGTVVGGVGGVGGGTVGVVVLLGDDSK